MSFLSLAVVMAIFFDSRVDMIEIFTTTKRQGEKIDKIDSPIHTECIHSGGAVNVIINVNGANAVSSLNMRSLVSWNMDAV